MGVHSDEQVGPLVTIGFGGVMTELLSDITSRPVPVSRSEVEEMIAEVKVGHLLRGFRGGAPAEVERFIQLVQRVAWAAHVMEESLPEFELNPVIVGPVGTDPIAVDWVIR